MMYTESSVYKEEIEMLTETTMQEILNLKLQGECVFHD